jgi:hypothetical protein
MNEEQRRQRKERVSKMGPDWDWKFKTDFKRAALVYALGKLGYAMDPKFKEDAATRRAEFEDGICALTSPYITMHSPSGDPREDIQMSSLCFRMDLPRPDDYYMQLKDYSDRHRYQVVSALENAVPNIWTGGSTHLPTREQPPTTQVCVQLGKVHAKEFREALARSNKGALRTLVNVCWDLTASFDKADAAKAGAVLQTVVGDSLKPRQLRYLQRKILPKMLRTEDKPKRA